LTPGFYRAHQLLGLSYLQTGDYEQAVTRFQAAIEAAGRHTRTLALMAHAYAAMGNREEVAKLCAEVEAAGPGKVSAMDFCLLYSAAGDLNRAFDYLERAFSEANGELHLALGGPHPRASAPGSSLRQLLRANSSKLSASHGEKRTTVTSNFLPTVPPISFDMLGSSSTSI
jgi:tetratricopeptide (TPR) repeat protein